MTARTGLALEPRVLLQLGRISNLPTVWSNVLAGMVLAGGVLAPLPLATVLVAASLMYTGGMFLNDAFDAEIDARERPERPIPSGRIGRGTVFAMGFGMLGSGIMLLAFVAFAAAVAGVLLAGAIVLYDAWHKGNLLSPVVMGACRVLVYAVAGFAAVGTPDPALYCGAAVLLAYLIGLTYVAKQENLGEVKNLWPLVFLAFPFLYALPALGAGALPALLYVAFAAWVAFALTFIVRRDEKRSVPRTVISLIAGISLLDALLISWAGATGLALLAVLCFAATMAGQRWVRGT
jgi:4-hydroxybenzoate polyprenyltransferase